MAMDCKERILSEDYYDFITDFSLENVVFEWDNCSVDLDGLFNLLYINRLGFPSPMNSAYQYQNLPKLYGLMQPVSSGGAQSNNFDLISLTRSGITQVQRKPLSLTGQGVILCFIDTGIEYTNPAFLDENGNTRIIAIWDQTVQTGTPPKGFLFGTEYTREDINRALQASDPYSVVPSRDEIGHGSVMAGLAAGSPVDGGRTYLGAAPNSEIVVVKLKQCKQYLRDYYLLPQEIPAFEETDIMMAVKYADNFAQMFFRPVVICLGIGTNMGDHNGNSALSTYLNIIATKRSRAVVISGGNEGNAAHHFSDRLERRTDNNADYSDVEVRVGENNRGFLLELWGNVPDVFNVSIRSPGGETIPMYRIGVEQSITYGFIYERTEITIASILVEPSSGEELLLFRIVDPTPGIWTFRVSSVGTVHNGTFNMWLPITGFLTSEAYFLQSDPFTTLTEPSMAASVICVSTYNDENNSFYIQSGRGFARNGRIRPDIAAPGVNISTIHGKQTGSSLSAAITAGGVAQFMQWAVVEQNNQLMESKEVKNYLIRGATRSPDLVYPNREWGYGRLNIMGIFDSLTGV